MRNTCASRDWFKKEIYTGLWAITVEDVQMEEKSRDSRQFWNLFSKFASNLG